MDANMSMTLSPLLAIILMVVLAIPIILGLIAFALIAIRNVIKTIILVKNTVTKRWRK